jgi:hypothetical protein
MRRHAAAGAGRCFVVLLLMRLPNAEVGHAQMCPLSCTRAQGAAMGLAFAVPPKTACSRQAGRSLLLTWRDVLALNRNLMTLGCSKAALTRFWATAELASHHTKHPNMSLSNVQAHNQY